MTDEHQSVNASDSLGRARVADLHVPHDDAGEGGPTAVNSPAEDQTQEATMMTSTPEIVVVGGQSTGKTGIASAVSGISLPRCGQRIRCPTRIVTRPADEWSCTVYLQLDYAFEPHDTGNPITEEDFAEDNKYPTWKQLPGYRRQRVDFMNVGGGTDAGVRLEDVIRKARTAIVNPSTPHEFFLPLLPGCTNDASRAEEGLDHQNRVEGMEKNPQALFSPNVVVVEVGAPDLPVRTLTRVPGVITWAGCPEHEFLERVLENMTREHISNENALVLCTSPMNVPLGLNFALGLVEEENADDRCVGVGTKADLVENVPTWIDVMDGKIYRLGRGHIATSVETGGQETPKTWEVDYFNRVDHPDIRRRWPDELQNLRHGVETLRADVSAFEAELRRSV